MSVQSIAPGKYKVTGLNAFYSGCSSCRSSIIRTLAKAGVKDVAMLPLNSGQNRAAMTQAHIDRMFPELKKSSNAGIFYNANNRKAVKVFGGITVDETLINKIKEVAGVA